MRVNDFILYFVIYPRGGLVAAGVRFVTLARNLDGPEPYSLGDDVPRYAVLRTWWRSLTLPECKSMVSDGITFDRILDEMDVIQI